MERDVSMKTKRNNIKSDIIKKQSCEIDRLRKKIESLDEACEQKDMLISAIDDMRDEFVGVLQDLKDKRNEYDKLVNELILMKKVMNKEVFKGKWNIIRFLLK